MPAVNRSWKRRAWPESGSATSYSTGFSGFGRPASVVCHARRKLRFPLINRPENRNSLEWRVQNASAGTRRSCGSTCVAKLKSWAWSSIMKQEETQVVVVDKEVFGVRYLRHGVHIREHKQWM